MTLTMEISCLGGRLQKLLRLLMLTAALIVRTQAVDLDSIPKTDGQKDFMNYSNSGDLQPARWSCDASYSAPCARTNARWLAIKAAQDLNAEIEAGNITITTAFDEIINKGGYNLPKNFYPFVLRKSDGKIMAHGAKPSIVNTTYAEYVKELNINFYDTDYVLNEMGKGGWVRYIWKSGDSTYYKSSYCVNLTDEYILGVGYEGQDLPAQTPCSANYDSFCSINNALSLVGKGQFLLTGAKIQTQFEEGLYQLSFKNEEFTIPGGFYLFMYHYSGRCVSHAILHESLGMYIPDIFVEKKLGTREAAEELHQLMILTAERDGGGWLQYLWTNGPDQKPFTKVAYVVKIEFQGEKYYLGCGFKFNTYVHDDEMGQKPSREHEAVDAEDALKVTVDGKEIDMPSVGYNGTMTNYPSRSSSTCTSMYNTPCSSAVSLELASHATTHAISSPLPVDEIWRGISLHPLFKLNDFYIFVYDFNSTCVAHGAHIELVGLTMSEIYKKFNNSGDEDLTHGRFKKAAEDGGRWVIYEWLVPGTVDTFHTKIAYIWRIEIGSRSYYAGIGYFHRRAPIQPYAEKGTMKNGDPIPCSSQFSLKCSADNAKALAGNAAANLTQAVAASEGRNPLSENYFLEVYAVLKAITDKDPNFFFNDFTVSVFWVDESKCKNESKVHKDHPNSGCCAAHGGNPEFVGKSWQEIFDILGITSVGGEEVNQNVYEQSGISDRAYSFPYSGPTGEAKTKITISSRIQTSQGDLYVVVEYFEKDLKNTCDSCQTGYECTKDNQVICTEITPSYTNQYMEQPVIVALVAFIPLAILISVVLGYLWYRNSKKKQELDQKIRQMESQMKDMVEIVHDTGVQIMTAEDYRDKFGDVGVGVEEAPRARIEITWYWEESERLLSRHHSSMIMPGENFVKYGETQSAQIERAYQRWKEGKGFKDFRLDLTQASGSEYVIDFEEMTQLNVRTSCRRCIRRQQRTIAPIDMDLMNRLPPLPNDIDFFSNDGEDFLPTYPGQVIQVSKVHPSQQWLYGSVLYDPLLADAQNRPQGVGDNEGLNRILAMALHDRPTSGWFPAALAQAADVKVMQNLVESLGGEGVTNLKPPGNWKPHKEGLISVEEGSAEYDEVAHFFLAALYEQRDHVSVVGVERIQCMPLWQSYAVKKETMRRRDAKSPEYLVNNRSGNVERRWLFHGTTAEVIPKIVKQGFNRAFAGRNAVAFGKGVYFARDAAYSSHQAYSTPDSIGIQRMFLCRVAVGDWCKGNNGQLTPDPKPRNQLELFDSTVDDVADPTIFVVYHDAQAYPDYLVSFRRHDEESD